MDRRQFLHASLGATLFGPLLTDNVTGQRRLPATAAGQNVVFKWRFGADNNGSVTGWWVDSIQVAGAVTCATTNVRSRADFDGDGRTDLSVFRASEGNWFINRSTSGFAAINWGVNGDVTVPGDYDGDGKADTAIFRADANESNPDFYILNSGNGTVRGLSWGVPGDVPAPGRGPLQVLPWRRLGAPA